MRILGYITDATTDAPVGGARVVLEVGGHTVGVNSDREGRFRWRDDSPYRGHRLDYRADKPGFEPLSGSREIADEELRLDLRLQPRHAAVRVVVVDPEGRRLEDAGLRLERDGRVIAEGTSGAGGEAELAVPDPSRGTPRYRVSLEGYETATGPLDVARTDPLDVVLRRAAPAEPANPFEAVRRHSDYARLMRRRPSTLRWHAAHIGAMVFGVLFMGFGVFWILLTSSAPEPAFLRAVGLLPMAVGAGLALYGLFKLVRFGAARLRRVPARVIGKRTRLSGGGNRAGTSYYVTYQLENGERREQSTTGKVSGLVVEGDMGVAYSKHDQLIDFRRVDA